MTPSYPRILLVSSTNEDIESFLTNPTQNRDLWQFSANLVVKPGISYFHVAYPEYQYYVGTTPSNETGYTQQTVDLDFRVEMPRYR